jgi:hypothetical protein
MSFSYDRVWADVVAMIRANGALLATLAGVFMFLPSLALWMYAPMPTPPSGGESNEGLRFLLDYYRGNWPLLLLVNIVGTFGQVAILTLLLDRDRPTVEEALGASARLLPIYFVMTIITNFAVVIGFFLFLVPGIYVLGRLTLAGPVMVGDGVANPVDAIRRSWTYSKGLGWRIAGLVMLIGIVAWIALSAVSSVLGVAAGLLLPEESGAVAKAFADALSGGALGLLIAVLSAAIFRQLRSGSAPLKNIFS